MAETISEAAVFVEATQASNLLRAGHQASWDMVDLIDDIVIFHFAQFEQSL